MLDDRPVELLALRLDKWLADEASFLAEAQAEYSELRQANLGGQMLTAIGTMYL